MMVIGTVLGFPSTFELIGLLSTSRSSLPELEPLGELAGMTILLTEYRLYLPWQVRDSAYGSRMWRVYAC